MTDLNRIADDVVLGEDVSIVAFANLYGCTIGDQTKIGPFVEIQAGATVGARCKVSSHTFVCEGVTIEDEVFIGHHVCFTNDLMPRATNAEGRLQTGDDWELETTVVRRGASIGSGAVILAGIEIGEGAVIGAGAVVTKAVRAYAIVAGVPARPVRNRFPPAVAARLEAIAWWDWPHDEIHSALDDFRGLTIDAFLEKYEARQGLPDRVEAGARPAVAGLSSN